jgi:peptidoglycan/LPS O-acetylase OafA/YrhL
MRYIGRISYGIYLYHMLVELFASERVTFLWRFGARDGSLLGLAGHAALAIGFAALSWHLMERPLLDWQRRGYRLGRRAGAAIA